MRLKYLLVINTVVCFVYGSLCAVTGNDVVTAWRRTGPRHDAHGAILWVGAHRDRPADLVGQKRRRFRGTGGHHPGLVDLRRHWRRHSCTRHSFWSDERTWLVGRRNLRIAGAGLWIFPVREARCFLADVEEKEAVGPKRGRARGSPLTHGAGSQDARVTRKKEEPDPHVGLRLFTSGRARGQSRRGGPRRGHSGRRPAGASLLGPPWCAGWPL